MRLGIAAVLVLRDPEVKLVICHERFNAPIADRAAVIERKIAVYDIWDEVGPPHGEATHRVGLDIVLRLEKIIRAAEAIAEDNGLSKTASTLLSS